jgi:hypoxanthine phosphoribosyltransferase
MDTNAKLYQDMTKILVKREDIQKAVAQLGREITHDYQGRDLVMVCILKGASVFFSDLIREVDLPVTLDFMALSSYRNSTKSSGVVNLEKDLSVSIKGRDVLIVEDIVDSGNTLFYLGKYLMGRGASSIRIATLLDKPARRKAPIHATYAGFEVPDAFVVGYGLDYAEEYRNLPFIGVLKPEVYSH